MPVTLIFTMGEYSTYRILAHLTVPSIQWCKERYAEWMPLRKTVRAPAEDKPFNWCDEGDFVEYLVEQGAERTLIREVFLGAWGDLKGAQPIDWPDKGETD